MQLSPVNLLGPPQVNGYIQLRVACLLQAGHQLFVADVCVATIDVKWYLDHHFNIFKKNFLQLNCSNC